MNIGSLKTSAAVQAYCVETDELSSASNAMDVEVTSSSSAVFSSSKRKKSRPCVKDGWESDLFRSNNTAECLTDGCENQSKRNGRKKFKRDEHVVFTCPLLLNDDLLENRQISDGRTEVCTDLTNENVNLDVCSLNCMRENVWITAGHELAGSSVSGSNDDLPKHEEGLVENHRKSRKRKKGGIRKEIKKESAVNGEKPTETVMESQKKKSKAEVVILAKDCKSSADGLTDSDAPPLDERQQRAKRKRETVVSTPLLSETPPRVNRLFVQLMNKPTSSETGCDGEVESESRKKSEQSLRSANVGTVKEMNDEVTGAFWLKPATSCAGVPRPNKNLLRRKMRCPVDGCLGRSTRIKRHIMDCHPELEASERERLLANMMANPCDFLGAVPAAPVAPLLKRRLRCPIKGCFGKTIRMRRHLINCHSELTPSERDELWEKVSQNSMEYVCASPKTSTSVLQEVEEEATEEVTRLKKTTAGIPRPNFKVRSRRRKQTCPVDGCRGAAINMRRHLVDCHSNIAGKHEVLLEKLLEQRREQRANAKETLKRGRVYGGRVSSDVKDRVASSEDDDVDIV